MTNGTQTKLTNDQIETMKKLIGLGGLVRQITDLGYKLYWDMEEETFVFHTPDKKKGGFISYSGGEYSYSLGVGIDKEGNPKDERRPDPVSNKLLSAVRPFSPIK